jgi:methyl-accepting chemotaxis protein
MKTTFALSLLVVAAIGTLSCYTCRNKNNNPAVHTVHCSQHVAQDLKEDARDVRDAMEQDYDEATDAMEHSDLAQDARNAAHKVADKTKQVGNKVKETVCDACGVTKKAGTNAKDAAKDVTDTVKDTATRVGHVARKGALKTVDALSETAQKIGHAVKEGALDAKDTISEAKDKAKRS